MSHGSSKGEASSEALSDDRATATRPVKLSVLKTARRSLARLQTALSPCELLTLGCGSGVATGTIVKAT